MATLISIPHRRPIQQLRRLILADFQYEGPLHSDASSLRQDPNNIAGSEQTVRQLRDARDRFARKIPIGGNELCFSVDRAAVLDVYQQSLANLDPQNHKQISSEANLKIRTILGLRTAEPYDVVFTSGGTILKPLEPQYAEPRIEYGDDTEAYRAAWRLKAWRKEGWPDVYPKEAIDRERWVEKMPSRGGQGDDKDWGDEVDANQETL